MKDLGSVALSTPLHQGELWKRGETNKAWKKRWCVLCLQPELGGTIFYYFEKQTKFQVLTSVS